MTPRWLACAAVLAGLAYVPAAHADEPYLRITTSGSPAATLSGEWEHVSKTAHLVLRGVTSQVAPTTFDAGITFPAVGKRTSRCPSFLFTVTRRGTSPRRYGPTSHSACATAAPVAGGRRG